MSDLVRSQLWGDLATAVALKGALILVVALVATRLLRRQPASVRHGVWLAAILAQVAIPALGRFLPVWRPELPAWTLTVGLQRTAAPASAALTSAAGPLTISMPTPTPTPLDARSAGAPSAVVPAAAAPARIDWGTVAFGVWGAGAALVFFWLLAGSLGVTLIARRAERVTDGAWLTLATRAVGRDGAAPLGRAAARPRARGAGDVGHRRAGRAAADRGGRLERRSGAARCCCTSSRTCAGSTCSRSSPRTSCSRSAGSIRSCGSACARCAPRASARATTTVLRHGTEPSAYVHDLLAIVRAARPTRVPALAALAMARPTEFEGRVLAILDASSTPRRGAGRLAKLATVAAAFVARRAARRDAAGRGAHRDGVGRAETRVESSPNGTEQAAAQPGTDARVAAAAAVASAAPVAPPASAASPAAPADPRRRDGSRDARRDGRGDQRRDERRDRRLDQPVDAHRQLLRCDAAAGAAPDADAAADADAERRVALRLRRGRR